MHGKDNESGYLLLIDLAFGYRYGDACFSVKL
jgi:hypothetical protein